MLPYWLLFAFFAAGAMAEKSNDGQRRRTYPALVFGALIIALMIGFRYEVGGDWENYEATFVRSGYHDLEQLLVQGDPGYALLNWFAQQAGGEIWLVNLVGGLIFSWGLLNFASEQRNPWLTVLVAIPYLVIVVGMGYSRQAIAIGVLMAGLAARLRGGSILKFALYVALAAIFHKTAVVLFPLIALTAQRTRFLNFLLAVAVAVLLYDFFLSSSVDFYVRNYIEAAYQSEGAEVRVAMSLIPAVLFLIAPRRFGFSEKERLIWRNFSLAAIGLAVLLFVLPSTTAVDRTALYIIPLQLAVLSRVPNAYLGRRFGVAVVVLYSLTVQYTWLNYGSYARYWIPYEVYPLNQGIA